jgi:hypothetical protein
MYALANLIRSVGLTNAKFCNRSESYEIRNFCECRSVDRVWFRNRQLDLATFLSYRYGSWPRADNSAKSLLPPKDGSWSLGDQEVDF